jgi:hypothetical protein
VIIAIESSTEIERNEKSSFPSRRKKNVIENGKKTCFSRVAGPIGVLKLVEVR